MPAVPVRHIILSPNSKLSHFYKDAAEHVSVIISPAQLVVDLFKCKWCGYKPCCLAMLSPFYLI